jgi:hypothetical protein
MILKRFPLLFLLAGNWCEAQNLIPNGSFEDYSGCPVNYSEIDSALYWTTPTAISSSDYYNECATPGSNVSVPDNGTGYQEAYSGVAYSGIYLIYPPSANYREYLEVMLPDSLHANTCYHFEMVVNLTNTCQYTTDAIGAYFSDTAITGLINFSPIPLTPQVSNSSMNLLDTLNWTLVSGEFLASGGEKYLIIGNFADDNNTPLYLTDPSAPFDFVYALVDNVLLVPCKTTGMENIHEPLVTFLPNPATRQLHIHTGSTKPCTFILYDFSMKRILQQEVSNNLVIDIHSLPRGLYLYDLITADKRLMAGKIVLQ